MATNSPLISENKSLADITTFRVEAKARWFAEYDSERQLRHIMRQPEYLDHEVFHIGGGSNILFTSDYDGLVLKSNIRGIKIYRKNDETVYLIAGAAEEWDDVVKFSIEQGLSGLENLSGIPGQAGASAIQNIGAYGVEAADHFFKAECLDTHTGEIVSLSRDDCQFGYRDSIFKREARGRYYVLRVSYLLKPSTAASNLDYGPLKNLENELGHYPSAAEVREKVIEIRNTKLPDPALIGSAGSFFKNPVVHECYYHEMLLPQFPEMPHYKLGNNHVKVPAGWLIEHAGLKGEKCGGAIVWPDQCLVIANTGGATAQDITSLADRIVDTVHNKFNIRFEREVNYISTSISLTILGSGTSKGVPEIDCRCHTCTSSDPHDNRMRCSALVKVNDLNILIDVSPDFREQALRFGIDKIDCILLTHEHYDHIGGIEDLRPFCGNGAIPVYALPRVAEAIRNRLAYCFAEHAYPGIPRIELREFTDMPFYFRGVKIDPIEVFHGKMPIAGFRIGNLAYITDAKTIDFEEILKIHGVDTLVVNALRPQPHFAHFSIDEALNFIKKVNPKRAFLTHMSHEAGRHDELAAFLPENIKPAFDGMIVKIN